MKDGPLTGTVALVTGASSGIGAATARRLAHEGAAIALLARRRDGLDRLAADIENSGSASFVIEADTTRPEVAEEAVTGTLDRFARLDILVNNTGIMLLGTALHTTVEEWDRMIELNVLALLHVTHAAVPYLIDAATTSHRRCADIVNVGSTAGRTARAGSSVFCLTQAGLTGFSESLRQELLVERVRVSVVAPGAVEVTDQLGEVPPDAARYQINTIEALLPADIADAIGYVVTRDRRVAVNEILLRAAQQRW